jgi:hypothetical protein
VTQHPGKKQLRQLFPVNRHAGRGFSITSFILVQAKRDLSHVAGTSCNKAKTPTLLTGKQTTVPLASRRAAWTIVMYSANAIPSRKNSFQNKKPRAKVKRKLFDCFELLNVLSAKTVTSSSATS